MTQAGLDPDFATSGLSGTNTIHPEYGELSDGTNTPDQNFQVPEVDYELTLIRSTATGGGANVNLADFTYTGTAGTDLFEITVRDRDQFIQAGINGTEELAEDADERLGGDNTQTVVAGAADFLGHNIAVDDVALVFDQVTGDLLGAAYKIIAQTGPGVPAGPNAADNYFLLTFTPAPGTQLDFVPASAGTAAQLAEVGIDPDILSISGGANRLIPSYNDFVVCFASGTMIETILGEVAVEDLKTGDLVRTLNNGFKPLAWVGKRDLSGHHLRNNPRHRPIRIRKGALGDNQPSRDLFVSPQHRMLVCSSVVKNMFGEDAVLVPAIKLLEIDGVDIVETDAGVTYWHLLFDCHEVIYANGAQSESLYTGPEALKALSPSARKEIAEIMPEVFNLDYTATSSFRMVRGKHARLLAQRHVKNQKPLVSARLN